jgi:hypothetical protein
MTTFLFVVIGIAIFLIFGVLYGHKQEMDNIVEQIVELESKITERRPTKTDSRSRENLMEHWRTATVEQVENYLSGKDKSEDRVLNLEEMDIVLARYAELKK